jgi:hypothetical protein
MSTACCGAAKLTCWRLFASCVASIAQPRQRGIGHRTERARVQLVLLRMPFWGHCPTKPSTETLCHVHAAERLLGTAHHS